MRKLLILGCYLMVACRHDTKQLPAAPAAWPATFGFGRVASAADIARLDIDVSADGTGLPAGKGTALAGKAIYMTKCAACHGKGNEPDSAQLLGPLLVTRNKTSKLKTIGNYWPYATTLFDYIRRAMPYNEPGSLTNEEVYHLTAYLLYINNVIKEKEGIDATTLPNIEMPAHSRFVNDDRRGGNEVR